MLKVKAEYKYNQNYPGLGTQYTTGWTVERKLECNNFHEPLFDGSHGIHQFLAVLCCLGSSLPTSLQFTLSWLALLSCFSIQHSLKSPNSILRSASDYRLVIETP
jgi:hypothetical protein